MQIWLGFVGAVIGASAALFGQMLNHRLTTRRDVASTLRHLTAELLAQGRSIQHIVGVARSTNEVDLERADRAHVPFVRSFYELKWVGPAEVTPAAVAFVDAVDELVKTWRTKQVLGFLDQDVVDTANAFEDKVRGYLARPGAVTHGGRWILSKIRLVPRLSNRSA